jgi:hypothetical protein
MAGEYLPSKHKVQCENPVLPKIKIKQKPGADGSCPVILETRIVV